MVRVPTMPASSTTTTSRGPRTTVPIVQLAHEPRQGHRRDAGGDLELLGGPGAERRTRDEEAG